MFNIYYLIIMFQAPEDNVIFKIHYSVVRSAKKKTKPHLKLWRIWSIFMNNFDYTSFQTVSDQVKMSGQAGLHQCSMLQELDEEAWLLIWASSHLSKRSVSNTLEF